MMMAQVRLVNEGEMLQTLLNISKKKKEEIIVHIQIVLRVIL